MRSLSLITNLICTFLLLMISEASLKKINLKESNSSEVISTENILVASTTTRRPALFGMRVPCACDRGDCGCCSGILLERFRQKFCANITFIPEELAFHARLIANGRVLFENTISGRNPPPLCARIPRFRFITVCLKFSNVYLAQKNVHMCMGLDANWEGFTLFDFSFDCLRFGTNGIAVVNPTEGGGLPGIPLDSEEQTDEDYDDSARNVPFSRNNDKSHYIINNKALVRRLPTNELQILFYKS